MDRDRLTFFVSTARGLADLLADELRALGVESVRPAAAGVAFRGPLEQAYRACLWSRTASRVLLTLGHLDGGSPDALYQGLLALPWEEHLSPDGTLAVDVDGASEVFRHTRFAAQRVKDGVVDRLRSVHGRRPSVRFEHPDLRLRLHLDGAAATLSLDLSGEPLHRRGYRLDGVEAPLRENLAAGVEVLRVVRGVSRNGDRHHTRCAARFRLRPNNRSSRSGFRLVLRSAPVR